MIGKRVRTPLRLNVHINQRALSPHADVTTTFKDRELS
ncbi:hypothetical protein LCGC14_1547070, partial [marine sediment metagenome]